MRAQTPSLRLRTSQTFTLIVTRLLVGGGGAALMVIDTVFAACAPVTALLATLLLLDSVPAVLTARTAKYHVPGDSELTVAERRVMSSTVTLLFSAVVLVP